MLFFESLEVIEEVARLHLEPEVAHQIVARSHRAIAFCKTADETDSWRFGDALLPEGQRWPEVNGRALVHTARLRLDDLPIVIDGQPLFGYLSFFDGYPWSEECNWDLSDYGCVIHDDGSSVRSQRCPLVQGDPEYYYPQDRKFLKPMGMYWTVPPYYDEVCELTVKHDSDTYQAFSDALSASSASIADVEAQLFGKPAPIQGDLTMEPRFNPRVTPIDEAQWLHLATFDDRDVFAYYFACQHKDLKNLEFKSLIFDAQCC